MRLYSCGPENPILYRTVYPIAVVICILKEEKVHPYKPSDKIIDIIEDFAKYCAVQLSTIYDNDNLSKYFEMVLRKYMNVNELSAKIKMLSRKFRLAIEKVKSDLGIPFDDFPHGACGDSSILLGAYLYANTGITFDYYLGERMNRDKNDKSSHAWLQCEELIVDITGNQFEDFQEEVYVGTTNEFFESFHGKKENKALISIYDTVTKQRLEAIYNILLQEIEDNKT